MSKATLIDTTKCIGCRSCQVSCKAWNQLPAEQTSAPIAAVGLQNPKTLSSKSFVVVTHHEVDDPRASAGFRTVFAKRQCMHCNEPSCAAACPVTAMHKTAEGPVTYDASKCIGCRYCLWACPWGVPTADWTSLAPKISKCTMCYDRIAEDAVAGKDALPSCVKQCPAGALKYGDRDELLAEARRRIKANPDLYVDHIYGEKEAGGTGMLYLAAVPFEEIGFPKVSEEPYPHKAAIALGAVPPSVVGIGALLGATYVVAQRREKVALAEAEPKRHVEFAPQPAKTFTPSIQNLLIALMTFGGLSFIVRFLTGLGASTDLSNTYAWGLWIVFDLVWIALAAGAFATAGMIYVFRREDLYGIGRAAVYLGLLSYSFVAVTLVADLGLPWHFYQLALNIPHHSAMYEVSWCIGMYVTILALEFLPVVFEKFGLQKYTAAWRKYSPLWVVASITIFTYLMSRSVVWTALAFATFAVLGFLFRAKEGEAYRPVMLAIAAVTFSTMHQSSLGSLFLLMPDKLNALWWSPIIGVEFFLSSIVAGTALIVIVDMWIAKSYGRRLQIARIASIAQVTFWSLAVFEVVRIADVVVRGQLANVTPLFGAEVVIGGIVPLVLLATKKLRATPQVVFLATFLAALGVIFNRVNVVLFGMNLKGPLPQIAPATYVPTMVEWGITAGVIATAIYLFNVGTRHLPILEKEND